MSSPRVTVVRPPRAIEGGRVALEGSGFLTDPSQTLDVRFGEKRARVVYASPTRVAAIVPAGLDGGPTPVRVLGNGDSAAGVALVDIAAPIATGLHQVDNPAFDRDGNMYVTYSGTRGQEVPVSIFLVRRDGTREPYASGIVNPTSLAVGPDGRLYVSSRFEGTVYRVSPDGT